MKVNEKSKAFAQHEVQWAINAALMGGTLAMRARKDLLPKWPAEEQDSYDARLNTATLFPAFKRTVSIMAGKPFSKELTLVDAPPEIEELCEDIDLQGRNLHTFSFEVFKECLAFGICGILVDYPIAMVRVGEQEARPPRTVAEEKALKLRPYFLFVTHDQLLGARVRVKKGVPTLEQLRIMECVTEDDGEFGELEIPQVRVIEPYKWRTYREQATEDGKKKEWLLWEEGVNTLGKVPFAPCYGTRLAYMMGESPLNDVALLNVKHWQSQSDQDTILHVARVPMLAVVGGEDAGPDGTGGTKIVVGSKSAINVPVNGDVKWVEHTGAAIDSGAKSLKDLEDQMIQTGAELLVVKPGQRTATESNNEGEANKSDLQRMAEGFEDALNLALSFMAEWLKKDPLKAGTVTLFKDFGAWSLTEASASVLLTWQQGGLITKKTALEEGKRRGFLSPDIDPEDELAAVEEEGPPAGGMGLEDIDPLTGLPRDPNVPPGPTPQPTPVPSPTPAGT